MLRWSLLVMSCFISALAVAQTGSQSAFESGKTFGEGKNQGIFSGITGGAAQSNIPRYGYSTPEANHFAGGKGETSGPGVGKINSCANYAPGPDKVANQECEAVNFLARNPQVRPQFTIGPNDPLIQKYKQYKSNAEQAFAQFFPGGTGSQSQCVTRNETIPGQYSTETCVSAQEVGTNQCTMGRVINIDTDANFQCKQTINAYETLKCKRGGTVSCTGGGDGCSPDGIGITNVSVSGFGRYLIHPAGGGNYWFSVGTIAADGGYVNNLYFNGIFYDVFESNITFNVAHADQISTFFLDQILYDDNIAIWVNGTLIYSSIGGNNMFVSKGEYVYDSKVCNGIECRGSWFEGGASITNYGGVELKHLIKNGLNTIKIKLAVGKNGDGIARFKFRAFCPLQCSLLSYNECAELENRAR